VCVCGVCKIICMESSAMDKLSRAVEIRLLDTALFTFYFLQPTDIWPS
jgi:hypothetical protein